MVVCRKYSFWQRRCRRQARQLVLPTGRRRRMMISAAAARGGGGGPRAARPKSQHHSARAARPRLLRPHRSPGWTRRRDCCVLEVCCEY